MNQTSTQAVDGMTPYEAAFGMKPNLKDVHEWGEKIWVRIEGGDKLGGHVCEGKWIGIDKQSKGVCVYWPDKLTVGIKRNIYYDKTIASVSCLKGENDTVIETRTDLPPANVPSSSTSVLLENPVPTPHHAPTPPPVLAPDPPVKKHVCKLSQCVLDIVEGCSSSSN